MAKFTASVPLNIRLPGGFEVSGAAGATHRIPDSLAEEFERDQAPRIPGFAWVLQDESSHGSVSGNPHAVSVKLAAAVHNSADLTADVVATFSTLDTHINATAFDGFTILTGTFSTGRVWASNDLGLTWQDLGGIKTGQPADYDVTTIIAVAPGVFLAGCGNSGNGNQIFKSTDSGRTWLQVHSTPTSTGSEGFSLAASPEQQWLAGSYSVSAGSGAKIWRSSDWGNTWSIVSSTETTKTSIRQIAHVRNNVYVAGVYGASPNEVKVYRSADNGATWASTQTIASTDIYSILSLPNDVVLLGTHPSGLVYRSSDIGVSFSTVADLSGGAAGQSQVMGLSRLGNSVLAFVQQGTAQTTVVYVSDDEGLTWTKVATLSTTYHYHNPVAVDHRTLVAGAAKTTGGGPAAVRFKYFG